MKISLLLLLIIQLHLIDWVVSYNNYGRSYHRSYGRGYRNHGYGGRHVRAYSNYKRSGYSSSSYKRPYNRHKSHYEKSSVILPSGTTFSIRDPKVGSSWNCGKKSKLIDLNPNGKMSKNEYDAVKAAMVAGGAFTVTKIQKIENSCLWKRYKHRQKDILTETKTLNERLLFHGSRLNLELMHTGFNEQYASLGGTFGPGVYFADTSGLSNAFISPDATGTKYILFCRVTMGKMHVVTSGNSFPHAPAGYHSVKGAINPAEYIIYRGEQAYPAYLISFKG